MAFRDVLLGRAEAEIEANAHWWATHHSAEEAVHSLEAVHRQLDSLENQPESHGLSAVNVVFPYEIRDKLVGLGSRPSSRAVFTVRDDVVYALTVRRGAQDAIRPGDVGVLPSD